MTVFSNANVARLRLWTNTHAGYVLTCEQERWMADFNERAFRDALGCFTTGVTVVTTRTARGPLGMTANSFASVSLSPPLVLWSPARRSKRFPAFEAAGHFAIHILAADQRNLADHFAQAGEDFMGIDLSEGLGQTPILPGCAAVLECARAAGHDAGDHLILVGEVQRLTKTDAPPLIYHRGRYSTLT